MRIIAVIWLAFLVSVGIAAPQSTKKEHLPHGYELYSWRDPQGWDFCLLYSTSRTKRPEEVFKGDNVLHGLERLKAKLDGLPSQSTIVWMKQSVIWGDLKTSDRKLEYPPQAAVEDVISYAASRKIKVLKQ